LAVAAGPLDSSLGAEVGKPSTPFYDFLGGRSKTSSPQVGNGASEACGRAEVGRLASNLPPALGQHAGSFSKWGAKYGVDPKFLAAVSMLETGKGTAKAFRNKNNAMGVSNARGPVSFSSVDASIERVARVLAKPNGPYAGKDTIGQIASVYCSAGAGNDDNGTHHHWLRMVSRFYAGLGGNPDLTVK
jgi:hypothetical protein